MYSFMVGGLKREEAATRRCKFFVKIIPKEEMEETAGTRERSCTCEERGGSSFTDDGSGPSKRAL